MNRGEAPSALDILTVDDDDLQFYLDMDWPIRSEKGGNIKKTLIPAVVMVCLLMACSAMAMGRRGPGVDGEVSVPLLPSIVELREEPYYYHSGYYYHYNNNRWYYGKSKHDPWADLPRDHYPGETRYKQKSWRHDRGRDKDERGYDDRDDYNRDNGNRGHGNRR